MANQYDNSELIPGRKDSKIKYYITDEMVEGALATTSDEFVDNLYILEAKCKMLETDVENTLARMIVKTQENAEVNGKKYLKEVLVGLAKGEQEYIEVYKQFRNAERIFKSKLAMMKTSGTIIDLYRSELSSKKSHI